MAPLSPSINFLLLLEHIATSLVVYNLTDLLSSALEGRNLKYVPLEENQGVDGAVLLLEAPGKIRFLPLAAPEAT